MKQAFLALILLLTAALPAPAQKVTLPASFQGERGDWLFIAPESVDGDGLEWDYSADEFSEPIPRSLQAAMAREMKLPSVLVLRAKKEGKFRVEAWTAKVVEGKAQPSKKAVTWVLVGTAPVPPIPEPPTPDPPKPDPPVPPVPAPKGFRVLMIWEKQTALTPGQNAAVYGRSVAQYLDAKTVKDGQQPSWRRWDRDVDVSGAPEQLRLLWEAVQNSSEYQRLTGKVAVAIAVNDKVTVHEVPEGVEAMLALLKKYGGN